MYFFLFTTKFAVRFSHLTVFRKTYYTKIDTSECYHTVTRTVCLPEDFRMTEICETYLFSVEKQCTSMVQYEGTS